MRLIRKVSRADCSTVAANVRFSDSTKTQLVGRSGYHSSSRGTIRLIRFSNWGLALATKVDQMQ